MKQLQGRIEKSPVECQRSIPITQQPPTLCESSKTKVLYAVTESYLHLLVQDWFPGCGALRSLKTTAMICHEICEAVGCPT